MSRQLGSATGIALLATVFTAIGTTNNVAGHPVPTLTAYHTFLAGLVLLPALTIEDTGAMGMASAR